MWSVGDPKKGLGNAYNLNVETRNKFKKVQLESHDAL